MAFLTLDLVLRVSGSAPTPREPVYGVPLSYVAEIKAEIDYFRSNSTLPGVAL